MKTYWGVELWIHTVFTLALGGVPCYLLNRRMAGTQSRSGGGREEKNSQPLPGLEPHPARSPVLCR